jgi:tetratricopeptide (TPR) repeat protein
LLEHALEASQRLRDKRDEGIHLGNLGLAYAALGDARKAIEFYEQRMEIAREIGDRRGEAFGSWNLGLVYEKLGEIEKAIAAIKICVGFEREIGHPNAEKDAQYIEKLGRKLVLQQAYALYEQKEYEKALAAFQQAVGLLPDDPSTWNGLGSALESLKRFEDAVEAYTHAIELSSDSAYLYRNRANILLELDRLTEAEKDIAKAASLEPDHPYTNARQGYLALARGNFTDALSHFEFAAANDESKSWKFGIALSKFALGEADAAQVEFLALLADADHEEREEARNWLERIVKLKPELDMNAQALRELLK